MRLQCQLFGTLGCHLCERAEAELMPFVEQGVQVELCDIVEDEAWIEQYALRIRLRPDIDGKRCGITVALVCLRLRQ